MRKSGEKSTTRNSRTLIGVVFVACLVGLVALVSQRPDSDAGGPVIARNAAPPTQVNDMGGAPHQVPHEPMVIDTMREQPPALEQLRRLLESRDAQLAATYAALGSVVVSVDAALAVLTREAEGAEATATRSAVLAQLQRLPKGADSASKVLGLAFAHVFGFTDAELVVMLREWLLAANAVAIDRASVLASARVAVRGLTAEQQALWRVFYEPSSARVGPAFWAAGTVDVRALIMLMDACDVSWREAAELVYAPERALFAPYQTTTWLEMEADSEVVPLLRRLLLSLDAPNRDTRFTPPASLRRALLDAITRLGGTTFAGHELLGQIIKGDDLTVDMMSVDSELARFIRSEQLDLASILELVDALFSEIPETRPDLQGWVYDLARTGVRTYLAGQRKQGAVGFSSTCADAVEYLLDILEAESDAWRLFYFGVALAESARQCRSCIQPYTQVREFMFRCVRQVATDVGEPAISWVTSILQELLNMDRARALADARQLLSLYWADSVIATGVYRALRHHVDRTGLVVTSGERESYCQLVDLLFADYLSLSQPAPEHARRRLTYAGEIVCFLSLTEFIPRLEQACSHANAIADHQALTQLQLALEGLTAIDQHE